MVKNPYKNIVHDLSASARNSRWDGTYSTLGTETVSQTHTHMGRESVAAAGVEKSDMVPETNKKKQK